MSGMNVTERVGSRFGGGENRVDQRQGWCHGGSLDLNRLRRATLVPGFRLSQAPRAPDGDRQQAGSRFRPRHERSRGEGGPGAGRGIGASPPGGNNEPARPVWRDKVCATELQPKVALVATAGVQSTPHQYSNLTVMVVRRGATNVRVR